MIQVSPLLCMVPGVSAKHQFYRGKCIQKTGAVAITAVDEVKFLQLQTLHKTPKMLYQQYV